MEDTEEKKPVKSEVTAKEETPEEKKPPVVEKASSEAPPESAAKKPKIDYNIMPTRPYLDATVVPILLQALSALARDRPADPIQFLADFLIRNKAQYSPSTEVPEGTSS